MDAIPEFSSSSGQRDSLRAALFCSCCWALSGALLMFVAACYWQRYDACTFVPLFPPWCWAVGGICLTWLGFSRRRWLPTAILVAGWLAFLLLSTDAPTSFARACWPAPERGGSLRVVSLNCAGNSPAARDVRQLDPDIVLFQESPTADTLTSLATEMYGSSANLVRGFDPSILARGNVTAASIPPEYSANFVHARVEIDGRIVNVISLRLYPCPVRFDFWSAECWRIYRSNRETRRRQLQRIADYAMKLPADEPLILGGDFNCPPRDAVLELLKPWLADAFTIAGRGWGATIIEIAGWPLIRIDQIWANSQLRAANAFAHRAYLSDHHMTVADFVWPAERPCRAESFDRLKRSCKPSDT